MRLLGFDTPVWAIQVVECAERCAYYAVAFSLYTYLMNMLRMSMAVANAAINGVYIVIPLAACLASGIADGTTGQPRVLYGSICLYAAGLFLVTLSSLPLFYGAFPSDPSGLSYTLFSFGLILFSVGYGSMKVCTNPIMANSVRDSVRTSVTEASPLSPRMNLDTPRPHLGTAHDESVDIPAKPPLDDTVAAAGTHNDAALPSSSPWTASPPAADAQLDCEAPLEELLPRLFRVTYWVSNFGALLGIFAAPLLRNLDPRTGKDGDTEYSTGYYWSFAFGFLTILIGLYLYHGNQFRFPKNNPSPTFVLFRVVWRALAMRVSFAFGRLEDVSFQQSTSSWLDYAAYPHTSHTGTQAVCKVAVRGASQHEGYDAVSVASHPPPLLPSADPTITTTTTEVAADSMDAAATYDLENLTSPGWIRDCRATLAVCKAFVALPIYWLICNQFSTNLMYQASALNLPWWVPPEMFNNINVFSLLLFLVAFEKVLVPHVFKGLTPPATYRIVAGFALMIGTMVWCGVVQVAVSKRGSYSASEAYVLNPGVSKLSAGWLVVPYVLQGIASALVDPSVMEVAYTEAPERMKGQVMGLYWVASSMSGFLGIALSPVMKPQNTVALFFSFAAALVASTVLFYYLNAKARHA